MYSNLPREAAEELLVRHAALVKRIAYHLVARLPPSVQVDDLIQAGMLGLLDAAHQYDHAQGASFETYARIRIRGAMLDELRRSDWAPKSVHRRARALEEAVHRIEASTGRDARDHEIAREMGIDLDEYFQILQDACSCSVLNFAEAGLDEAALDDIGGSQGGPLGELLWAQFKERLAEAIARLPERERMVIGLYYDAELNLREIGAVLGVSESRVSQLLSQAHLRLRARLYEEGGPLPGQALPGGEL